MPSAADTDETEYDQVRRQIFNQILHMNKGLRRGLNPNLGNVENDEGALVRYFLAKDKQYQYLERHGRLSRCADSIDEAMFRRQTFENVIADLLDKGDLFYLILRDLSGVWALKVSAIDEHLRKASRRRKKKPVGFNDNSFHGRPRRDRERLPSQIAA